jgi:hypothetical protein
VIFFESMTPAMLVGTMAAAATSGLVFGGIRANVSEACDQHKRNK